MEILDKAQAREDVFPSLEEVVAKIQAAPPNPHSFRPAKGSLADALRDAPEDPHFDLAEWNKKWSEVEAEMKALTRADRLVDGRIKPSEWERRR